MTKNEKNKIVNHERLATLIVEIEGIVEREELDNVEQKLLYDLLEGRFKNKITRERGKNMTNQMADEMFDRFGLKGLFGKKGD